MAEPAPESWSDIASWYDDLVVSGSGPHETALECTLQLAGDVRDLRVLDLACGQGLASRPSALLADRQPVYASIPIFLGIRAVKSRAATRRAAT